MLTQTPGLLLVLSAPLLEGGFAATVFERAADEAGAWSKASVRPRGNDEALGGLLGLLDALGEHEDEVPFVDLLGQGAR